MFWVMTAVSLPACSSSASFLWAALGCTPEISSFFLVKSVKFGGIAHKKGVAEDGFGGIAPLLVVQAVHAAEVGDARFGADACAAEKDDGTGLVDVLL